MSGQTKIKSYDLAFKQKLIKLYSCWYNLVTHFQYTFGGDYVRLVENAVN
jgi:hypothetical protein